MFCPRPMIASTLWIALSGILGAPSVMAAPAGPIVTSDKQAHINNDEDKDGTLIRDIKVSGHGQDIQILLLFDQQPTGAIAYLSKEGLEVVVSGVTLQPFELTPVNTTIVTTAAGRGDQGKSRLQLSTLKLTHATTTLYKQSVLVTGQLKTALPNTRPTSSIAREGSPSRPVSLMQAIGLTQVTCIDAQSAVTMDAWNLDALGTHALCKAALGDKATVRQALEQLEAFSPEDWRGNTANAELKFANGERALGEAIYRQAIANCADSRTRYGLEKRLSYLLSR